MQGGDRLNVDVFCECPSASVVRTSKTPRNPNRQFWSCPNYKSEIEKCCNYFEWCDLRTMRDKELLTKKIYELEQQVAELKEENHRLLNELQTQGDNCHSQYRANSASQECYLTVEVDVDKQESATVATMISRLTIK